jgi:outer membrane receptor for monomeric catechols
VAADARAVERERDLFIDHEVWDLLGFYAQDDIRVNNEFTLNLGLWYDLYMVPLSVANTQSNFVDSGPNAGLIQTMRMRSFCSASASIGSVKPTRPSDTGNWLCSSIPTSHKPCTPLPEPWRSVTILRRSSTAAGSRNYKRARS